MSIYTELLAAGVPMDHHESDLYALVNYESRAIIDKYFYESKGKRSHKRWKAITTFVSQIDGQTWYDIPFSYDPFWEKEITRDAGK